MAVEILSNNDGILDCQKCDERLKEERGHDKEGIVPFWIQGKVIKRCPLTLITPLSYEYIKAFSFYDKGLLPNNKGWIEESNKFIQGMMILSNEFNKEHEKPIKKIKDGRNRS